MLTTTSLLTCLVLGSLPVKSGTEHVLDYQQAVDRLVQADEDRAGYSRREFRHWIDKDRDGCDTRREVLIEEAVKAPRVGARCAISGGEWYSFYDDVKVTDATKIGIDHMVPLAEAWDSGASGWTRQRRTDFANDLDHKPSLIAVTQRSNAAKSDRDPTQWLPVRDVCVYLSSWVSVKLRWGLQVDGNEVDTLRSRSDCDKVKVAWKDV